MRKDCFSGYRSRTNVAVLYIFDTNGAFISSFKKHFKSIHSLEMQEFCQLMQHLLGANSVNVIL